MSFYAKSASVAAAIAVMAAPAFAADPVTGPNAWKPWHWIMNADGSDSHPVLQAKPWDSGVDWGGVATPN